MNTLYRVFFLFLVVTTVGCSSYRQDILFQLDDDFTESDLKTVTDELDENYVIQPNDVVQLDVFTNNGEQIVNPMAFQQQGAAGNQNPNFRLGNQLNYTVQVDGTVAFPIIGDFKIANMTIYEAEEKLQAEFRVLFNDSFVKLRISNRRVFLLGALGGQVIPLENENTNLIEVLARGSGLDFGAKAQNIKVIRGKDVFRVDLSTISGMQSSNLIVQTEDIIYVEPWRRPWQQTLRDISPALSLVSSIFTLYIVIQNLNQQDTNQ